MNFEVESIAADLFRNEFNKQNKLLSEIQDHESKRSLIQCLNQMTISENEIYKVDFSVDGIINIKPGQTILAASIEAGIPHFHVCGGNAKCSTCRVLVLEGEEHLSRPNEKEQRLKNKMQFPPNIRLACQSYVTGESVKLLRVIRDEADIGMYIGAQDGLDTQQIGEELELTLFFLDIRNFTSFIESNPPFDAIHIIRKLFSMFQNCITQYKGMVLETAGDGLYAVFGFEQNENSADNAVKAGLRIFSNLEEMNISYFSKFFCQDMDIGIGIHMGKVISGNFKMGDEVKTTVMGLPVNIAARLQNATKQLNNSFVVSDKVYQSLLTKPSGKNTTLILKGITLEFPVWIIGSPYKREYL